MKKFLTALCLLLVAFVGGLIIYAAVHETIPAGYVGYVYDRTASGDDNVIPGTSVINEERTGRIKINPVTQDVLKYPTTIISKNWTCLEEGDGEIDMSMQVASREGKNVDADIYVSVRPTNVGKIIKSFGTKSFDAIIDNDIYGLAKGKLSSVTQDYSIYDLQSNRTEIQQKVFTILSDTLNDTYGVELVRFELGTLNLPSDIQVKIDQKTEAQNEVELARLERQKQEEVNQQIVDQQKAQSEKEKLLRQTEADAAAYEITKNAEAQVAAQEAQVQIARLQVEQAKLEKEAALEGQKTYTDEYFRDKELDVQLAAVTAINSSLKTIVTSGDGEGYDAILGLKEILKSVEN